MVKRIYCNLAHHKHDNGKKNILSLGYTRPMIITHYLYKRPSLLMPHSLYRWFLWYIPLLHFQQVKGKSQSPRSLSTFPPCTAQPPSPKAPSLTLLVVPLVHPSFSFSTSQRKIPIHHDDGIHHEKKCLWDSIQFIPLFFYDSFHEWQIVYSMWHAFSLNKMKTHS
jgi:hypothetical protein